MYQVSDHGQGCSIQSKLKVDLSAGTNVDRESCQKGCLLKEEAGQCQTSHGGMKQVSDKLYKKHEWAATVAADPTEHADRPFWARSFWCMSEQELPDMPGIMQSSRIRSGRTLLFEIHFKASAPEVSQCSCTTQPRCQLVCHCAHTHTHRDPPASLTAHTCTYTHVHTHARP